MVSSVALPRVQRPSLFWQLIRLLPGVGLLAAIGCAAKLMEEVMTAYVTMHHLTIPKVEYVLWAIVIGLVVSNTVTLPRVFEPGIASYELWLKLGIVLMGARFVVTDVMTLGGVSLALVIIEVTGSLAIMTLLGRVFGLRPKLISLLAMGSAVCGVSAIIAAKGAIDADDEDSSFAIAVVLALGALALLFFPLIGHAVHMSDPSYGLWAGLAVDNTAESIAAGALYSDAAGKVAVLAKTCRSATIGFVVLGYALYWASRGQAESVENKATFLWKKFPKFILGFLAISVAVSFQTFNKQQIADLTNVSRWVFLLSFAGIGLRTNFRRMYNQGLRPFVVGLLGEVLIAALTFGLVVAASRAWAL